VNQIESGNSIVKAFTPPHSKKRTLHTFLLQ